MSDNQQATDKPQQTFSIQKIYVKDVSLEIPNAPHIFTQTWEPQVNLDLNSSANMLADGVYEVDLSVTVTVNLGDKTAYLVEVKQAGIFSISGFNEQEVSQLMGSFCPNVLFPYARETVSDLATRGGFPQLLLAPVNFDAIYAQQLAQQATASTSAEAVH